jgi:hypothetical protein
MAQVTRLQENTAPFERGKDLIERKIKTKIIVGDKYDVWYVSDFKGIASPQVVRKILNGLAKEGRIKKYKTFPNYYKTSGPE